MKQRSLKKKFQHASILLVLTVFVLLVGFNLLNNMTMKEYHNIFTSYHQLNSYFEHIELATDTLREYLYTENEETLQEFHNEVRIAEEYVGELCERSLPADFYRFDLLRNMTEYYKEKSEYAIEGMVHLQQIDAQAYEAALTSGELITSVSGDYYDLLTNEMNQQMRSISRNNQMVMGGSLLLMVFLLLMIFYFLFMISRYFTRPLYQILENINNIKKGAYDMRNISSSGMEMNLLCQTLDEMAVTVKNDLIMTKEKAELQKQLLEKENENLKKDELLAKSELRMLQNQINPHFLFNTLNMIYKLSLEEEAYMTGTMIEKTSRLLRYGLDKQNHLSDLYAEIESVQNYIDIQKKRMGKRIRFLQQIAPKLPNIPIPGMILQPLIENSIHHGLKNCMEDGEIMLCGSCENGVLTLSVSDNGEGMDSFQLEAMILNDYRYQDEEQKPHLGLYNVVKRLEAVFGENLMVSINSSKGCGFECILQIRLEG